MNREPKVTIATVTFNCLEYTKLFLESLRKHADVPYRLIVIDNHSTDGTAEYLARQKGLEVVLNKRNLGFGWANNQAFSRAKTPYFLGINNDTVIFSGFLSQLLKIAEQNPDYGEFGVHSNCIGAKDPRTSKKIDSGLKKLAKQGCSPSGVVKKYYGNYTRFFADFAQANRGVKKFEVPPNFIGGWCFLVHTEAVKKAGGLFDRRFRIGFWEDVDLSWRLALAGYKIGLAKEIYLHHFTHISFAQNELRLSDRAISRANAIRFVEKWGEEIVAFLEKEFKEDMPLVKIARKYFVIQVLFGKRKDYTELEKELKRYLRNPKIPFKEFLLKKRDKR